MKYPKPQLRSVIVFMLLFFFGNDVFSQHTMIPTGTTTDIDEIRKFGNVVVINGDYQFLQKCYDDCDVLIPLTLPVPNYPNVSLSVLDTNRFYVVTYNPNFPGNELIVSKTIDGGQTWTPIYETILDSWAKLLVFDTNNVNIVLSGEDYLLRTSNGGTTWQQEQLSTTVDVNSVLRVNDSIGLYANSDVLMYTADKGSTWEQRDDQLNLVVHAQFATTGDSLYLLSESLQGQFYFSYIFNGFLGTRTDIALPNFYARGVYAVSKDEIYLTGMVQPQNVGRILKTTDLGETWTYYDVPGTLRLSELVFLNDTIALIGAQNGVLLKWNKNSPMIPFNLGIAENSIEMLDVAIFPNPATDKQELQVNVKSGDQVNIHLIDLQGRNHGIVYSGIAESDLISVQVDLSRFDSGVYSYQVQVGDRSRQIRFLKY